MLASPASSPRQCSPFARFLQHLTEAAWPVCADHVDEALELPADTSLQDAWAQASAPCILDVALAADIDPVDLLRGLYAVVEPVCSLREAEDLRVLRDWLADDRDDHTAEAWRWLDRLQCDQAYVVCPSGGPRLATTIEETLRVLWLAAPDGSTQTRTARDYGESAMMALEGAIELYERGYTSEHAERIVAERLREHLSWPLVAARIPQLVADVTRADAQQEAA